MLSVQQTEKEMAGHVQRAELYCVLNAKDYEAVHKIYV